MVVTDRMEPISTLYYDGKIGSVNYNYPSNNICGELLIKRMYKISSHFKQSMQKVSEMFDVSSPSGAMADGYVNDKKVKVKIESIQPKVGE